MCKFFIIQPPFLWQLDCMEMIEGVPRGCGSVVTPPRPARVTPPSLHTPRRNPEFLHILTLFLPDIYAECLPLLLHAFYLVLTVLFNFKMATIILKYSTYETLQTIFKLLKIIEYETLFTVGNIAEFKRR